MVYRSHFRKFQVVWNVKPGRWIGTRRETQTHPHGYTFQTTRILNKPAVLNSRSQLKLYFSYRLQSTKHSKHFAQAPLGYCNSWRLSSNLLLKAVTEYRSSLMGTPAVTSATVRYGVVADSR